LPETPNAYGRDRMRRAALIQINYVRYRAFTRLLRFFSASYRRLHRNLVLHQKSLKGSATAGGHFYATRDDFETFLIKG
jgi:hypothetical protein